MTLYAATKKATEGMAHSYAHLWRIPTTAFRFFSVYGPWGRPDMAFFKFARGIVEGTPIDLYNHGAMARDFTYIDDLAEGIVRLVGCVPGDAPACPGDSLSPAAPFRAVNIGRGRPEKLLDFLAALEKALGKPAVRNTMPKQPGDPETTWADASLLAALTGYTPTTSIEEGTRRFADWYRTYRFA